MRSFVLRDADDVRTMWSFVDRTWRASDPPLEVRVDQLKQTRSSEQNARMWAMLEEVSQQVVWHGHRLSGEEWKHVFTASLKNQRVVPGIDGGFVVIGARTSSMTISQMSELIDLMQAFGAEHGVHFRDPIPTTEKA